MTPSEVVGGHLWAQRRFPFHRRYVTMLGHVDGKLTFALLTSPDDRGSMACTDDQGRKFYSPTEAFQHLTALGYEDLGPYSNLPRHAL